MDSYACFVRDFRNFMGSLDMMIFVINCVDSFISTVALLAHAIGLLSIHLYEKKNTQNIILSSLSVVEAVECIIHLFRDW